jgi:uncharacterized repeat protein (TIGR03803 family)
MSPHCPRATLRATILTTSLVFVVALGAIAHADARVDLLTTFDATAMSPAAPLIQGADGSFYGTTSQGGPANAGTIFRISSAGVLTVLYAFTGGEDGAYPYGGLVQDVDGSFYGTTSQGGAANAGTIYRLTPFGNFGVVYAFTGTTDGASPYAGLLRASDGSFYGTSAGGGVSGAGTIFRVWTDGTFAVVYAFTGADDGGSPYAGLVQGSDGNFYGTTYAGGSSGAGTIFQLTPTGVLTVRYSFTGGADGAYPYAGVVMATDASLFGVASQGAANGQGSIFRLELNGTFAVIHSFATDASDGAYPLGGLTQAADGSYFGTTVFGGAANVGTIFQFSPDGAYSVLYEFTGGDDGGYPYASMMPAADGAYYGTTSSAGSQGGGTAFRLSTTPSLVTWATPAPIVYGTRLSAAQLNATASVPGTFVYLPLAGTRLHAGSQTLTVVFTPTDSALPVTTSTVTLTVLPATPILTWNPPTAIAYGTPLGSAQLNARANVEGVFIYDPGAGSVVDVGTQTLSVTFFPNSSDFTTATATVAIVVTPGVPVITWTPVAMVYGTALGPAQLNAVANTAGTFVYTPSAGTVPALGVQTLTATFTPADSVDYVATSVSATVNVAIPSASGGSNEYALQFTPAAGARGLVVAGYTLAADPAHGTVVIGNCSYYTVTSGSGRGGGYRTVTTYHYQTCTWDAYGSLLSVAAGAPVAPPPLSVNGSQTIYASDTVSGIYAGVDSALASRGFVFTPGSHYSWLTPNPYAVIPQAIYTVTMTLKSDGNMPLGVSSVQAGALAGTASVSTTTCTGAIPVGSTCDVTVRYDPTHLQSPTGLAYDTLTIHLNADSGQTADWTQRYTIQLTPANTGD